MESYRRLWTSIAAAAVLVALSSTAMAQSAPDLETPPRVQLGVTGGALIFLPTVGARLTVPVADRLALEGAAELLPWMPFAEERADYLLFQAGVRHRFGRWRTWRMHGTYGLTFYGTYTHVREVREPRPDGSVIVYPDHRRFRMSRGAAAYGGIGGERLLANGLVVRWDVQAMMPIGMAIPAPRASFGIAWPGGRRQ